jgi:uncharacterized protein (TIGR01777 family)
MSKSKGKIVITGGSGFLGVSLARALLDADYEVCLISRHAPKEKGGWRHVEWDAKSLGEWAKEMEGAEAIVNLAGRSVDVVKTPDTADEILRSRVETTRLIGRAMRTIDRPPASWIQMSTAHIYGDSVSTWCTEESAFGYGLAPFVGKAWEAAFEEAALPNMRKVLLRTSFVLGRSGGALPRLALIARLGLGGKVGNGKQGLSWLHVEDMNRLFIRGIQDEKMSGAYVASAPNPVSNAEFMSKLRKALGVPVGLPTMEWMVRIGAPLLFKSDPELVLYGRYTVSKRLKDEGFVFRFANLDEALEDIYSG